jgi:hypothetical protein
MWGLLLVVLGGFLAGGTIALWRTSRPMAAVVGVCAVIAVAAGVLRMDYFA